MDVYDADSYKRWIRSLLDRLSPALEQQLRTILSAHFHPRVVLLDTEVFPDGLRDGIPMRMFQIDAHNSEVFHDDPAYLLPSSIGILEEIAEVIPHGESDRQQRYEGAGVDTIQIELATLLEWFAACWVAAGGQQCPVPAYVCYHDDRESFDLRQLKWEPNVVGKATHYTDG
jgi:hypothetical protein